MDIMLIVAALASAFWLVSCKPRSKSGGVVQSGPFKDRAREMLAGLQKVRLRDDYTLKKDESRRYFVAKDGGADNENQPKPRIKRNGTYKRLATKYGGGMTLHSSCKLNGCLFQYGEAGLRQKQGTNVTLRDCTFIGDRNSGAHNMLLSDDTRTIFEGTTTLIDCKRGISQSYTEHGDAGPDDCDISGGCHTQSHPNGSRVIMRGNVILVNSQLGQVRHPNDSWDLTTATIEKHGACNLVRISDDGRAENVKYG